MMGLDPTLRARDQTLNNYPSQTLTRILAQVFELAMSALANLGLANLALVDSALTSLVSAMLEL